MANKDMVIQSDYSTEIKSYALIRCIAHEIEAATAKILKTYGLSETQLNIIHALDSSDLEVMTVNQIKEVMIDDSPNVSRSLNKLMENGHILKERDLMDQRVVKIRLTDTGRQIHHEADQALLGGESSSHLTQAEFDQLYQLLKQF